MYPLIGIQMGNKYAGMLSIFYVLHPVFNKMPNCFLKNKINWRVFLSSSSPHIFINKDLLQKSLFKKTIYNYVTLFPPVTVIDKA
jgi:hypothetical protein